MSDIQILSNEALDQMAQTRLLFYRLEKEGDEFLLMELIEGLKCLRESLVDRPCEQE